jgi:tetratricopeptide (TPR) repeat protein
MNKKPDQMISDLEKAKKLVNQAKYREALDYLEVRKTRLENHPIFHNMKGVSLQGLNEHDLAVSSFLQAVKLNPLDPLPFTGIANSLFKNLQFDEAKKYYELSLVIDENYHDALVGLGSVAFQRSQYDVCENYLKRALEQRPQTVTANTNLANCYSAQGRHEEALKYLEIAARNAPENSPTFLNLGLIKLGREQYDSGWDLYEHRFHEDNLLFPRFSSTPRWQGPSGKTEKVLVWAEQGLGDEIMYASIYQDLEGLEEKFIVECDPRLLEIFKHSFPKLSFTPKTRATEAGGIDAQIPIASLPRHFRKNKGSFQNTRHPYLTTPPPSKAQEDLIRYLESLPKPLIGVSWESYALTPNFRERKSIPAEEFECLTKNTGATFINLQFTNPHKHESHKPQRIPAEIISLPGVDLKNDIRSLCTLISHMSHVVTIGNTVAHICGAIGKKTTVLLPSVSDWRWGFTNSESNWYPTLRLARNKDPDNWIALLNTLKDQLLKKNH